MYVIDTMFIFHICDLSEYYIWFNFLYCILTLYWFIIWILIFEYRWTCSTIWHGLFDVIRLMLYIWCYTFDEFLLLEFRHAALFNFSFFIRKYFYFVSRLDLTPRNIEHIRLSNHVRTMSISEWHEDSLRLVLQEIWR